jgi:hypothetical protein
MKFNFLAARGEDGLLRQPPVDDTQVYNNPGKNGSKNRALIHPL